MILAGITLYNPEIERLLENISAIAPLVREVVCIDNGSKNIEEIEKSIESKWKNVTFVKNEVNEGVARALNKMFVYAKEHSYEYVITLDQDSVCPSNIVDEYRKYMHLADWGTLCPVTIDRNFASVLKDDKEYNEIDRCITSASIVPVSVWEKVGGFCEELFIDFVDHDFCAKLMVNGYKIIQINSIKLLHELGNGKHYSIFGVQFTALNHSAFRKYYIVRNWIYYMEQYKEIIDVKSEKKSYRLFFFKTLLFENSKIKKMKMMLKGRRDGYHWIKQGVNNER